jgi:hypothetical protein
MLLRTMFAGAKGQLFANLIWVIALTVLAIGFHARHSWLLTLSMYTQSHAISITVCLTKPT